MFPPAPPTADLAPLSDDELIEKIEAAWRVFESVEAPKISTWDYFRRFWGLSSRQAGPSGLTSFLNGPGCVGPLHPSLALEPAARTHQALRDIRDLTNELERRVARHKGQRT
jgi:hypothetical protein